MLFLCVAEREQCVFNEKMMCVSVRMKMKKMEDVEVNALADRSQVVCDSIHQKNVVHCEQSIVHINCLFDGIVSCD